MGLKHVLIGLLIYKPTTGYSLHKRFFEPIQPVLTRIYQVLREMASQGLLVSDKKTGKSLRSRNVFKVTDKGHAELQNWLSESWKVYPVRDPIVTRLWFGKLSDYDHVKRQIEVFRDAKKAELSYYYERTKDIGNAVRRGYGDKVDRLYWGLVQEYTIRRGEAELEWAETALLRISRFKSSTNRGGKKMP